MDFALNDTPRDLKEGGERETLAGERPAVRGPARAPEGTCYQPRRGPPAQRQGFPLLLYPPTTQRGRAACGGRGVAERRSALRYSPTRWLLAPHR